MGRDLLAQLVRCLRWHEVEHAHARGERGAVHVDHALQPVAELPGCPGDGGSRIAVRHQRDVAQIVLLDEVGDVRDVRVQVRLGPAFLRALGQAGQRQRQRRVTALPQRVSGVFPGPRPEPGAGNEYEGGHVISLK